MVRKEKGKKEREREHRNVLALVAVDQVRKLDRVADEEDGHVQTTHVVISFLSVELDANVWMSKMAKRLASRGGLESNLAWRGVREATRVSNHLGRASISNDSRKAHKDRRLLANLAEERCLCVLAHVVGHLEIAVRFTNTKIVNCC